MEAYSRSQGESLDTTAIEGKEQLVETKSIPGWKTFYEFWEKNFPKLRIQGNAADICDKCYVIANMIQYKQAATGLEGKEALEAELNTAEAVAVNSTYVEAERNILQAEALIKEAAKHVDMQEKQRALFRRMKQEAVEAKKKDLPRRQQIWTF